MWLLEYPEPAPVGEQAEASPNEVIDLVTPPNSPSSASEPKGATKSKTASAVADDIKQKKPACDPDRARRECLLTDFNIRTRKVTSHLEKLVVPHEKHFKQAKTWTTLRGACVHVCSTAKSDQAVRVLHEPLCRWMVRMRRPIPAGILREIKEQVSQFAKFRGKRLFHFTTEWLIKDEDFSLD